MSWSKLGAVAPLALPLALSVLACGSQARNGATGGGATTTTNGGAGNGDAPVADVPPLVLTPGGAGGTTSNAGGCDGALATKSNVGCDFYALHPLGFRELGPSISGEADLRGSCFAVFVTNPSSERVELRVEYEGLKLDVSKFARLPSGSGLGLSYASLPDGKLPASDVAILFLSGPGPTPDLFYPGITACPPGIDPALPMELVGAGDVAKPSFGSGSGVFHITTSSPVVAYDIFPYGGGKSAIASATMLLPKPSWGQNYVGVSGYKTYLPWVAFVASEDDTELQLLASAKVHAIDGAPAVERGQVGTYRLNRGQELRVRDIDLSGSIIETNHPVAMWGGADALSIPAGEGAVDLGHQQLPPLSAWGNEYVGVRYRARFEGNDEETPWRVLGAVAATVLTYEPHAPAGAPTTLEPGELVEFWTSSPFVVRSQDPAHPFYMSAHMTGCSSLDESMAPDQDCRGDPEFVNVVATSQFRPSYAFFTDPTYPETNLVVVRKVQDGAFHDVSLDCAGRVTGWQDVAPGYQFTRVDLVRHNFEPQGTCDNGRHLIESTGPFGVTVWGWGSIETGRTMAEPGYSMAVSYAYPAGANVAAVNDVRVPTVK